MDHLFLCCGFPLERSENNGLMAKSAGKVVVMRSTCGLSLSALSICVSLCRAGLSRCVSLCRGLSLSALSRCVSLCLGLSLSVLLGCVNLCLGLSLFWPYYGV